MKGENPSQFPSVVNVSALIDSACDRSADPPTETRGPLGAASSGPNQQGRAARERHTLSLAAVKP